MSSDGSVFVGNAETESGAIRGFRWTESVGFQELGTLRPDNLGRSTVLGVSADGRVLVGVSDNNVTDLPGFFDDGQAFRWTGSGGMEGLGTLRADDTGTSRAMGANADGIVIAGDGTSDSGARHAFRWTRAGGMQDLGTLRADDGGRSLAGDINPAGNVIVGWSSNEVRDDGSMPFIFRDTFFVTPFLWTESGGIENLGTLRADDLGYGRATGVSDDGTVVVGDADNETFERHAFRWVEGVGMQDLGTLSEDNTGQSIAADVSADGSVVVGNSTETGAVGRRAFRWTGSGGMIDLGTLRSDDTGEAGAGGVNDDGSVVVGTAENDAGVDRAFIWRADTMLDHVNTGISVQQSAQALAATAAHYGQNTVYQLGREVALRGPGAGRDGPAVSTKGKATPQPPVAVRVGGRLAYNDDVATSAGADVTAAVGLTRTLTLGGFVEILGESDSHSVVSLDGTHISGGASLRYRASPDGTGLTWRVAAVAGGGDFDVTRRDILPNTERGEGATSLTTLGLSAEVGYGYETARGTVTPFARLTGSRVERDGFAETNAIAFPLNYDEYEEEALTLTLGSDARFDVSVAGTLSLGAGVSHDLDRNDDPVTGTSAIPGLTNFSVDGPELENRTRGYVSAGYSHALGGDRAVSGSLSVAQSPWTDDLSVGARVGYEIRF